MFDVSLRFSSSLRVLATSALLWGTATLSAHAADLTLEVQGARSAQGQVAAALFSDAGTWMKTEQAVQSKMAPAGDKVVLVFRDLAPGRYAVSVFHDENGNGKLDTNLIGMPQEPYGFSRNAQGRMGPPKFDDAALDVQADTQDAIVLR
jgi:uncharacterized protein (DUF2141 family)